MVRDRAAGVPVAGAKVRAGACAGRQGDLLDRGQDRRPRRGGGATQVAGRGVDRRAAEGERPVAHRPRQRGRDGQRQERRADAVDDRQAALPAGPDDPSPRPGLAAARHEAPGRGRRALRGRGRQGQQGLQAAGPGRRLRRLARRLRPGRRVEHGELPRPGDRGRGQGGKDRHGGPLRAAEIQERVEDRPAASTSRARPSRPNSR